MAMSRAIICALSLVGQAFRFKRGSATIQGVKVHNYKKNNKEWVVFFKPGTRESDIKNFCDNRCDFQGHPDRKGLPFAKLSGSEEVLEDRLTGRSDVDLIETDEVDGEIPDVESYETRSLASWGLDFIGADSRPTTGKGVHIYVQDTGIRSNHQDFGGRAASAFDITSGSEIRCTESASCANDKRGHGTHCAGTAAGSTFGVAPDAKLYAVKTLSDQGSGARSWQYEGVDFVASYGKTPAVLSMSLGGRGADTGYDRAFSVANNAGVTVVVAAGNANENSCNYSPAFSSLAITVGATDSNNKRANYSNWGNCNDIMAPGSSILSAGVSSDDASSTKSGTSMACPHAAGAAALLLETSPGLSKDQILNKLKEKAVNNLIEDLKVGDPNYFLWVSSEPADSPAPTPGPPTTCPSFAQSPLPNKDGDCRCKYPQYCSRNGGETQGCPCEKYGICAGGFARVFSASCTTCKCYSS